MAQEAEGRVNPEITCREVVEWASAYLEDHVDDERKRRIVLHMAICAGCEAYVKQIATVRDVVGLLPKEDKVPSGFSRLRQVFASRAWRSHLRTDKS